MIKFNLIANKYNDGFKFSFQAEGKEEQEVVKELADKLISKIKEIKIEIKGDYE